MRLLSELMVRLRSLLFARREDVELDEELHFHIDKDIEQNLAAGMSPREARRQAHIKFGGVERMRERTREARGVGLVEALAQDARFALRQLGRHRSFAAVAVLTIAVGIGATASIFSVVRGVLLEPLPFADPARVVVVRESSVDVPAGQVAPGTFLDWRERATSLTGLSAHQPSTPILLGDGGAEAVQGTRVTADLLPMLGVPPELGRLFQPEEMEYGSDDVVVLSHDLWARRFGASGDILGRTIDLSGRSHTVVGVMPAGFEFPDRATQLWTPLVFVGARNPDNRRFHFLDVVGRLGDGVHLEQARDEIRSIASALEEEYPQDKAGWSARVDRMLDAQVAEARPALFLLFVAVGLLLLIALANVGAMFLVRGTARRREVATRLAVGASKVRIARQLVTESVLIASIGGALSLALTGFVVRTVPIYLSDTPRVESVAVDPWVFALVAALSLVSGALFGLSPLMDMSTTGLAGVLRSSGRGASDGLRGRRVRSALVTGQVGVAVVLLISAGLLIKSMAGRARIDPGFDPAGAFRAVVTFPPYATSEERLPVYEAIVGRLREEPAIVEVGTVHVVPTVPHDVSVAFTADGRDPADAADAPRASEYQVMPGFFAAMGVPLMAGRVFSDRDVAGAPEVAVVNETMARLHFAGLDPIGRRIRLANSETDDVREIVGVVGDVRTDGLTREPPPQVYTPFPQLEHPSGGLVLLVRATGASEAVADIVHDVVQEVRSDLPVSPARPLTEDLSDALARERLVTWLLTTFAVVALGLATLGVYGVVAYAAALRTHEMGVRMMLGAEPGEVVLLVLGLGARLVGLGIALGLIAALGATRLLGTFLYEVGGSDPSTFLTVPFVLGAVALLAGYVPARRVSRSESLATLRSE